MLMVDQFPQFIDVYETGRFAGLPFGVIDFDGLGPWPDDGGAGYDHGFTASMMAHGVQLADPQVRQRAYESLMLAADWATIEPCVPNINYTAKNIWGIAEAYALSGRPEQKAALLDKLSLSILPAMLTDFEAPFGEIDGVPGVRFSELHPIARTPGRCFDPHNVLPWYHSKNSWSLVSAYAALRDRGDAEAAALYPYAIAAVDSLASEFMTLGAPADRGDAGLGDIPIAILMGLLMIPEAPPESVALWQDAAWGLWNTGYFAGPLPESRAFAAALMLRWASDIPYARAIHRFHPGMFDLPSLGGRVDDIEIALMSSASVELTKRVRSSLAYADSVFGGGDLELTGRVLSSIEAELVAVGLLDLSEREVTPRVFRAPGRG